ncbi:MAG: hypothetical protein PHW79_00300 [Candidatus Marinimicrobia bacterium]|nr:hypothetical protein [Candidatus Neomarinimicrobiota bacterium]
MNHRRMCPQIRIGLKPFIVSVLFTTQIFALPGNGQNKSLKKPTVSDLRTIYARYEIPITNDGRFGWDPSAQTPGGGRWLRGTDEGYIFGAGIWIGAKIDNAKQVTVGYNSANVQTEMVPGNLPNEPGYSDPTEIVYISTDYPNAALPPWPMGYNEDGTPIAKSQMDSYAQCNDLDPSRQFEAGKSLGVLLTTETYSWNSSFRDVWDIAFLSYTIKNINADHKTWEDAYIGFSMDPDIGDPTNDLTGCFPDLNIGFAYSAATLSGIEKDLEHIPGYVGIKFLDGPARDPETGKAKMSSFRRWETDPNNDEARYDILSAGTYDLEDTDPADKRIFLSSGPFNLAYGDSTKFVVAICFAWPQYYYDPSVKNEPEHYADYLKLVAENAQFVYDNDYKFPQPPDMPKLELFPIDQKIVIKWDDVAEKTVERILSLPDFSDSLDFEGYKLWKSLTGQEGDFELLGQWDKVSFDDLGNAIGKNTGLTHNYIDTDLINGKTYFYAVTAYDKGEYQAGGYGVSDFEVVPPQETGMVFGVNLTAAVPNPPPSNFTDPEMEGLQVTSENSEEIDFSITPEYLIADSVKDKTFQIQFSEVSTFRYDKDVTQLGPDIYLVDQSTGDTIVTTLNFPVGNPISTVQSELFDGMRLLYTGPNLLKNKIDTVYFESPKSTVTIRAITEYDDFTTAQTCIPRDYPFGSYFMPHLYKIEFYELSGSRRIYVYDLDTPDTLEYVMRSFGRTFSIANYERSVGSVNATTGDTTWTWYNYPTGFKNKIDNTSDGFKIYIPGAFIFIEDLNREIVGGDVMYVRLSGVRAPMFGESYQFSTVSRQIDYHADIDVKVVPNPYLVRASWDIDNDYQRIQFINLPTECTLRIYTVAGDLVKTIRHKEAYEAGFSGQTAGTAFWDLMTNNNQKVATGIYVFYLDSPFGNDVGKFAVIR